MMLNFLLRDLHNSFRRLDTIRSVTKLRSKIDRSSRDSPNNSRRDRNSSIVCSSLMEGKLTHIHDKSRERKPSYKKAVGINSVEDQEETVKFENGPNNSSHVIDVFTSLDVDNGSSLEKTNVANNPVKTFYIQDSPHAKGEGARREKWSDFAESSSLHGLRNVFVRSSPCVRIFWLVLLLAFTAWVLYSMYSSIFKYFQYPIATVIRIRYPEEGMRFPAVSLCPMTSFTRTKIFMTDDDPQFESLGLDLPSCKATAHVRKGRPCGEALLCCCSDHSAEDVSVALSNCTDAYKKELQEIIRKDKKLFDDKKFQQAYGPSLWRMIIPGTCIFAALRNGGCTYKDFIPTMSDHGVCFTFNSGRDGKEAMNVSYGDTSTGLSMILDLNLNDHLVGAFSEGIRIIVHDQGVYINPAKNVLVAPGSYAQISVKRKEYTNKRSPYETKCTDNKKLKGFPKYDSDGCYYECISNETARKCGCRLPNDPDRLINERICFRDDRPCLIDVFSEMVAGTLKCDCPLACDVVSYETTTTTAAFPNPSLIKILQTRGYNRTDDYLRKNLINLQVAYTTNSYEVLKQKSQYDSGALMGEIGGNLGLFLGCSILTIIEFIDFAIYLYRTRNKKKF